MNLAASSMCFAVGALLMGATTAYGGNATEIYETLRVDGPPVCTVEIDEGEMLALCAGVTTTFNATVTCADGYEQANDPTWFLDGSIVGTGASIDLSLAIGTYVLTANCGSCSDVINLDVTDCVSQPRLDASFSNDATEESVGVFMSPNLAPVLGANFAQLKFNMRPFTLAADPSLASGTFTVDSDGTNLQLFTPAGDPIALPAEYDVTTLPVEFYVNATGFGETTLTATYTARAGSPTTDAVLVRVGPFPGVSGESLTEYPFFNFVDAFNENGAIEATLDGSRHAERDGLPYMVYVVNHQPAVGWSINNALNDVSGGAEAGVFSSASIQSNTLTVWASGLDAGTLVSKSYDIVYDFGLDGTLDPGDIIDRLTLGDTAGAYVVKDLTAPGPYTVADATYSGGTFLGQKVYYPTNIGSLGQVPLMIMSHGNGHQYTWYDYLGEHMASHGFIYMSHQNNTGPGIETASTTTLTNTDYILGNLGTIAGGVLDGHVDQDRILWSGHSRGGEGVARAYDRLFDGYVATNYTIDDINLVSSIAPTVFFGATSSDPHKSNYHVIGAAGDGDVSGSPSCTVCQYFRLADRAEAISQTMYVQGADHNDFNCCGFNDYTGPPADEIGRAEAQQVAKGYYLVLGEFYGKDNPAVKEYLTRLYEDLHPIGIDPDTKVALSYMDRDAPSDFVVDDFETNPSEFTSSSGGTVTFDVLNYTETDNEDNNTSFTWVASDPMNGNIYHSGGGDVTKGAVFDYSAGMNRSVEFEIVAGSRDIRGYGHVSFRAAQGTRHPETVAHDDYHSFSVTLRDGAGTSSTIHFGSWGRLTPLFQRTGSGTGAGWANEYGTVRIPIASFETDGSGIDLSDVVAIRLEFGAAFGSDRGRISIDDLQLTLE